MRKREVGSISHLHGRYEVTIREMIPWRWWRRFLLVDCHPCGVVSRSLLPDSAWALAQEHAELHGAPRREHDDAV